VPTRRPPAERRPEMLCHIGEYLDIVLGWKLKGSANATSVTSRKPASE
jgi:hypothetical protein